MLIYLYAIQTWTNKWNVYLESVIFSMGCRLFFFTFVHLITIIIILSNDHDTSCYITSKKSSFLMRNETENTMISGCFFFSLGNCAAIFVNQSITGMLGCLFVCCHTYTIYTLRQSAHDFT